MIFSTFDQFKKDIKSKNIIQIFAIEKNPDIKIITNLINYISKFKNSFIFESVEKEKIRGRYTIFGYQPDYEININNSEINIIKNGKKSYIKKDVYNFLDTIIKNFKFHTNKKLPIMSAMLVGYFGYDVIRFKEKIPNKTKKDLNIPDVKLIRPEILIIHDNLKNKIFYIKNIYKTINYKKHTYLKEIFLIKKIINEVKNSYEIIENNKSKLIKIISNTSKSKFLSSVNKAKKYIKNGDIFQVVLSQRFETQLNKKPISFYKKLRTLNPSPFMYFFNFSNFQIAGSSPEILVRLRDNNVTIRPIAGTRPRGKNHKEDLRLTKDLLGDKKELSEHLMLLDLGRNDVGKISKVGTVNVTQRFKIEKYSHVMHIVSNVVGKFDTKNSLLDVLFAGFPAGTVSGAPKIRAMEIIDQLETSKRKLYAGGIGYFTPNNEMDTCIALRTALILNKKIYVQSGAGIVADSIPINEYKETINKAKALFEAAK
jgi:anthranilate synthase component 1